MLKRDVAKDDLFIDLVTYDFGLGVVRQDLRQFLVLAGRKYLTCGVVRGIDKKEFCVGSKLRLETFPVKFHSRIFADFELHGFDFRAMQSQNRFVK